MYLIDWVQEWTKIETINEYIGYGIMGLMILIGIIAFIIGLIKN